MIDLRRIRTSCTVKSLFGSVLLSLLHFDVSTSYRQPPTAACHTSAIDNCRTPRLHHRHLPHGSPLSSRSHIAQLSPLRVFVPSRPRPVFPIFSRTLNFELIAWTNYLRHSSICIKASLQPLWKAPLSLPLQLLSFSTPIHLLSLFSV